METLILQEGEIVKLKIMVQLVSGYPQSVGDLFLTDRRIILLPNQILSMGSGKRWEIKISDIKTFEVKRPLQGGSFIGSLGNRIEIILKDNSKHILSTLSDISLLIRLLSENVDSKVFIKEINTSESVLHESSFSPGENNEGKNIEDSITHISTSPKPTFSQNQFNATKPQEEVQQAGSYFPNNQPESIFEKLQFKSAPSNVVCQNPNCKSYNTINVRKNTLNTGIWLLVVGFPFGLILFVIPGALAMTAGLFSLAYSFFIPANNWKCKTCKFHWQS